MEIITFFYEKLSYGLYIIIFLQSSQFSWVLLGENMVQQTLGLILVRNLNALIKKSHITLSELASFSNTPYSTINSITSGTSINPRLETLGKIARVFNLNISQLVGELPLNFFDIAVPILEWQNINIQEEKINFLVDDKTQYVSTSLQSKNKAFALRIEKYISDLYNINNIIIFEHTNELYNNCEALISLDNLQPVIKKVIVEDGKIYLQSVSNNLPLQQVDRNVIKVFGIMIEIRFAHAQSSITLP